MNYWAGGNKGNFEKLTNYMFSVYPRYNGDQVWEAIIRRVDGDMVYTGDYTHFATYVAFLDEINQMNGNLDSGLL